MPKLGRPFTRIPDSAHCLPSETAHQVWDVLVALAGAREDERAAFVRYLGKPERFSGHEYRFIGDFGFGGKLHFNNVRGARINCYPQDLTPERQAAIESVNARLQQIVPGRL